MKPWSIVTIVKNRTAHLRRLIHGAKGCNPPASEIVVVDMSDEPVACQSDNVLVKLVRFETKHLSLAEARNIGAQSATYQNVVFLDVDCIPQMNLIGIMDDLFKSYSGIVCGEVRYLGPRFETFDDEVAMMQASRPHPLRIFPADGIRHEANYGLFWSLLFAIRKDEFLKLGGFDTRFIGYGAEDTDFGFRAREAELPLIFTGLTCAFHQYHQVHNPPLQHFSDIIRNANAFFDKWGSWPMDGWLHAFTKRGLISLNADRLCIIRQPTKSEIAASQQDSSAYF